jgi:hypothetical protein
MAISKRQKTCSVTVSFAIMSAVVTVLGTGSGSFAFEFQGQVLDYTVRQLYHSPETPGYTAWTGLWKLPNGAIRCDFVQATGPQSNPTFTYPLLQSTNNGTTWTNIGNNNGYSRNMAIMPNGTTMVRADQSGMYFNGTGHLSYPNNDFMGVQYSTNGGLSWSQTVNLVSPDDYQVCLPLNIKPLGDGRLVAMAGLAAKGVTPVAPNIQKVMFIGSVSDQGMTWGNPIPLMTTAQGICEESDFVELPNGNLFFMHRLQHYDANGEYTYQDRKQSYAIRSGATFAPQTPTVPSFGSGGQGFPCELLTREGILLDLGLEGSHWSDNYGQTWHNLMVGGQQLNTYYYPQAVQAADGTIVVTGHYRWDDAYHEIDESVYVQTFRVGPVHAPEPGTLALLGVGGLALLTYAWQRRRRVQTTSQ